MISEKKIKKLLDEWDKSLTVDIKNANKRAGEQYDNLDQWTITINERSRAWYARDVVRYIRAKIFELEDW